MIESYQEEKNLETEEPQDAAFATVGTVHDDGMTLIWDESGAESQKHYKCNSFAIFHEGERVRLIKDNGTYVVEYSVGPPKKSFHADTAGSASTAGSAQTASNADKAKTAVSASSAQNALQLGGKSESALNVASAKTADNAKTAATSETANNALRLGGKDASGLDVASARTADRATDATNATTARYFTERHTGNQLGFFGAYARNRQLVYTLSSTEPNDIRLKLNEVISALKNYGLL